MEAVAALQVGIPLRTTAMPRARATPRDVSRAQTQCSACNLLDKCLSADLDADTKRQLDDLVTTRVRLRKGETLYRAGGSFTALYAIRSGSLKTLLLAEDGREQVAGYHMPGEILGLDGVGNEEHECQAIALEDSEVCVLPFDRVEQIARESASQSRS